jgi:probable HAF family extracellular repeat protein
VRILLLVSIAAFGTTFSIGRSEAAALYTITAIDYGSGNRTGVASIAENGLVTGSYAANGTNNGQLFRWVSGVFEDLGRFDVFVAGANSSGQLAAGDRVYPAGSTSFTTIGSLGAGFTEANAINESGTIVGQSALSGANESNRAFRWTEAGGIVDLGILPGGSFSNAFGINNTGDIVGTSIALTAGGSRSVIWTTTDQPQDIGVSGRAIDINNFGAIVGSSSIAAGGYYFENGNTTFLLNLAGLLDGYTIPQALNDLGQVVGYSSAIAEFFTISENGFLWDKTNGLQDLNDLIPENSGWFLGTAFDINNAGQIIGTGSFDGRTVGYLLTPIPEPAAGILGLFTIALLLLRRRRSVW